MALTTSVRRTIARHWIPRSTLQDPQAQLRCFSYTGSVAKSIYRPDNIDFPQYQGHCVKLSVINGATTRMLSALLVDPVPQKQKYMHLADYSFLVESTHRRKKVLFDLAIMKNMLTRMPPVLKTMLLGDVKSDPALLLDYVFDVPDTLRAHGVDLAAIDSIILSHSHIDHVGDPSVFPHTTDLIVGPGFKKSCMPGYPKNPNATILDSAFEGRRVEEVAFDGPGTTMIGGFRAVDLFKDSSFWLLECPGHTGHHMGALCRTTEDSWVLMGADCCSTVGQIRPNQFRPLPASVPAKVLSSATAAQKSEGQCLCGHLVRLLQRTSGSGELGAFYNLSSALQEDLEKAKDTLEKLRAFDAREDVMVILTHDTTMLDVIDLFPCNVNDWKSKGWADEVRWRFLKELDQIARA